MFYTVHKNVLFDLHCSAYSIAFFISAALVTFFPTLNAERGTLELKS